MASPTEIQDLDLIAGDTWSPGLELELEDVDSGSLSVFALTGVAVRLSISRIVSDPAPLYSTSSADGTITVGEAAGTIDILVPGSVTATWTPGNYYYQIRLDFPGEGGSRNLITYIEGNLLVTKSNMPTQGGQS